MLLGVSCLAANRCVAVGFYRTSGGADVPFAEHWNGASWSVQTTPRPVGARSGGLSAVSCVASNACVAVGSYRNSTGATMTLADVYNGAVWSVQGTANPAGAKSSLLSAVSCTAGSACMAAGSFTTSAGKLVTLTEGWNGTAWAVKASANPAGAQSSALNAVSCTASSACVAAGQATNSAGVIVTLAETWSGSAWTVHSTPSPSGSSSSSLSGISCVASTDCTSGGDFTKSSGTNVTLAEHWNGTAWSLQSTPNPAGATSSDLSGLSCTASSACAAVGTERTGAGTNVTLVESFTPTWTIQASPNPPTTQSSLEGVSCTASNACTAVGSYFNSGGTQAFTLAERWNGSSWAIQSPPSPGSNGGSLEGVSCAGANACVAVGRQINGSTTATLADGWDGSTWAIMPTPSMGSPYSDLSGVACTASNDCMAVGTYYAQSVQRYLPLAVHWDGSSWATVSVQNSDSWKESLLSGISCTAGNSCTAVGSFTDASGSGVTLVEVWDGTGWTMQTSANPPAGPTADLQGVSCPVSNACTAVGHTLASDGFTEATLAEGWNGSSWTIQSTPAAQSRLSGVSCTTSTRCVAVGHQPSIAEVWNGSSWTLQNVPAPQGGTFISLMAVSCTASNDCTAVGSDSNSTGTKVTLTEHWNGTSWAIRTSPNPLGVGGAQLFGVSCTTSSACTAVGTYPSGGVYLTLAERWNGRTWAIQSAPSPTGARFSVLSGVSCTAGNACVAVGSYADGSGLPLTLAEVWNGSSWTIQSTPNPTSPVGGSLSGVSCTASDACTAVGNAGDGTGINDATLVERWDGSAWTIQPSPNATGARSSILQAVSCTASDACAAVGTDTNSGAAKMTLAERWTGSAWTIASTPNPSGGSYNDLTGVSCSAANACLAVGHSRNSAGTYTTLSERWNGSAWSLASAPTPSGATSSDLSAIACTASNACITVGSYTNRTSTTLALAYAWTGSSWTLQSARSPAGAGQTFLSAVACPTSSACTGVGSSIYGPDTVTTLTEGYF
jgi:hypothetical protein